jgi:very-short-patch-repair endonuclease
MAAVLACGPSAALSHTSAATLWGLSPDRPGTVHVTIRRASPRRPEELTVAEGRMRSAIRAHRRARLRAKDVDRREGIPVTGVVQTLLDLAVELPRASLERAVNEADRLNLVEPDALREALAEHAGEPGVRRLRDLLDRRTFRLTASELERRFLRLTRASGMPDPFTGAMVNGFEVDFHWPELGLVVETDGLRYHRTPAQQARDRLRDQAHTAAGLTTLRFTHAQVRFEARHVAQTLEAVVRRLAQARRSSTGLP